MSTLAPSGFRPSRKFGRPSAWHLVLIPLAGVFLRSSHMTGAAFLEAVSNSRAMAAYKLTFGAAAGLLAAGGLQATRESARLQRRPPLPHRRLVGGMRRFERTGIGRPPTELGIGACRTALPPTGRKWVLAYRWLSLAHSAARR